MKDFELFDIIKSLAYDYDLAFVELDELLEETKYFLEGETEEEKRYYLIKRLSSMKSTTVSASKDTFWFIVECILDALIFLVKTFFDKDLDLKTSAEIFNEVKETYKHLL